MKKKLLALFLAAVMVIGAAIGGTLAYLTSEDNSINVATTGNVKIEQLELQRNDDGSALVDFKQGQPLYPAYPVGANPYGSYEKVEINGVEYDFWDALTGSMDKLVMVKNTGRSEAYFRTWIALECPTGMELGVDILVNKNETDIDWIELPELAEIDGQTYAIICATYKTALAAGATSVPSILQVVMADHVGNEFVLGDEENNIVGVGDTYEILAFTEACQTKNMPSYDKALEAAFGNDIPWDAEFEVSDYVPNFAVNAVELAEKLSAGEDVTLAEDITLPEGLSIEIPEGADVVLDLNGNNLSMAEAIVNNGKLTINGAAATAVEAYSLRSAVTNTISTPNSYAIENEGDLVINGGTFGGLGCIRSKAGTITINGGNFYATSRYQDGNYQHTLKAVNTTVNINGGNFDATVGGQTNAVFNASTDATITINGGNFKNVEGALANFDPYLFTYEDNGKVIIKDGTFYGGWRFNGTTASTEIYGGNFTVGFDGQSFKADSTHVLSVYGGTFVPNSAYPNSSLAGKIAGVIDTNSCVIKENTDGSITVFSFDNFVATNDAELAEILELINDTSACHNKEVTIKLAGVEFSADHTIRQYPTWNGKFGGSSNLGGSAAANAPYTNITLEGQANTVFTGNVNVVGTGNSNSGFSWHTASTKFVGVTFDGANSVEENGKDYIVLYTYGGANDVSFESCTFVNASHITLGYSQNNNKHGVGEVSFDKCLFNNGGCLSGYIETLSVTGSTVTKADKGFINKAKAGDVTVDNCTVNVGEYFLRTATNGSGVNASVTNTAITLYEASGTAHLVYFRGSNESATFDKCTIPANYTTAGVDANSTLEVYTYSEANGFKLQEEEISGEVVLYNAAGFTGTDLSSIPEGVTAISNKVFNKNTKLTSVSFPESLTTIGYSNFNGCTSLETAIIHGGITLNERTDGQSNAHTFAGCTSLTTLVLEEGVTSLPTSCFTGCTALTEVTIPASMKYMARRAFYDCLSLEKVYILSTDCEISEGVFDSNQTGKFSEMTIYVLTEEMKAEVEASLGGNNKNSVTVELMTELEIDGVMYTVVEGYNGVFKSDDNNYHVWTAEGLTSLNTWMKDNCNKDFWGKTYNIMADIDATTATWNTIYASPDSDTFNGITFNGNGHTISNLTIDKLWMGRTLEDGGAGLFAGALKGTTSEFGAVIKDITLDNLTVNGANRYHVGSVWGEVVGSSLTVDNVTVKNSTIIGQCNVGGLVGRNSESKPTITFNDCEVLNTTVQSTGLGDYAGASSFLGMALEIGNDTEAKVVFTGTNKSEGNTLISAEGQTGGGYYTRGEYGTDTWTTPEVVDEFVDYDSTADDQ